MFKRRNLVTLLAGTFLVAGSAMAQFSERNIKFTNGINEDHPVGAGVKKMQEIITAKSGGKMKITAFWGGMAGGDLQATQALRAGTQEMVCTSSSPLVGIVKELGVFDLPFLFANEKEADAVLDGPAGKYFNAKLEAAGLVNLAYWENGFRNLTNSKRPVAKLEDFEGVKVRVMQNNIFLDTFKTLGTNAVPMAFTELYTAMESKAVDGQDNPVVAFETNRFHEVQKHLSLTRHVYNPLIVLMSKKAWDKLSTDEHQILTEAARETGIEQRRVSREMETKALEKVKAQGTVVTEITPQERVRLRERVRPVTEQYTRELGEPLVKEILAEIDKVRGKP